MSLNSKVIYDRRSGDDRRSSEEASSPTHGNNGEQVEDSRRMLGDRRKTEGLEISTADLADDEFDEVFKQFQKQEPESENADSDQFETKLEIIDYQVLYRKGVECAYITVLKTDEHHDEPTLYAFTEQQENADSQQESSPLRVQNIFGAEAYESYIEQGWDDISKTENDFPWALKTWLALNMKQDEIKSR